MIFLNFIVEGSAEESFVNDVLKYHFLHFHIYTSARRIRTGWDNIGNRPAKGGLLKYIKFRNDVLRWIESDRDQTQFWYTSMIDLYAFPKDALSPYTPNIQTIQNPLRRVNALEAALANDIHHPRFIPYVQLHEFEAFLMIDPDRLLLMYPYGQTAINRLKRNIGNTPPEEINDSQHTAPSKRIIQFFPEYKGQKAQAGPMIAEDIGLPELRRNCPHFDQWITTLENI